MRKLTDADFASLTGTPGVIGYYALAISFPNPRWLLVEATRLANRVRSSPKALLEGLSDRSMSAEWTHEYVTLLSAACRQIKLASFDAICQRALAGRDM